MAPQGNFHSWWKWGSFAVGFCVARALGSKEYNRIKHRGPREIFTSKQIAKYGTCGISWFFFLAKDSFFSLLVMIKTLLYQNDSLAATKKAKFCDNKNRSRTTFSRLLLFRTVFLFPRRFLQSFWKKNNFQKILFFFTIYFVFLFVVLQGFHRAMSCFEKEMALTQR